MSFKRVVGNPLAICGPGWVPFMPPLRQPGCDASLDVMNADVPPAVMELVPRNRHESAIRRNMGFPVTALDSRLLVSARIRPHELPCKVGSRLKDQDSGLRDRKSGVEKHRLPDFHFVRHDWNRFTRELEVLLIKALCFKSTIFDEENVTASECGVPVNFRGNQPRCSRAERAGVETVTQRLPGVRPVYAVQETIGSGKKHGPTM